MGSDGLVNQCPSTSAYHIEIGGQGIERNYAKRFTRHWPMSRPRTDSARDILSTRYYQKHQGSLRESLYNLHELVTHLAVIRKASNSRTIRPAARL
jgi:hypothetical protein